MTHPLPRWRGAPADEPDHRLSEFPTDHRLRGGFLVAATDLADHDDRAGGWVILEEPEHLTEGQSEDRIAADSHRRALSHARLTQTLDDLVGERSAA